MGEKDVLIVGSDLFCGLWRHLVGKEGRNYFDWCWCFGFGNECILHQNCSVFCTEMSLVYFLHSIEFIVVFKGV